MRVSKVKVKAQVNGQRKDQMVLMQRETSKGSLIYEGNTSSDRTTEIIPDLKKENFALSILNQTLISEKVLIKSFSKETSDKETKKHKRKALENFLRSYINSIIAIPRNVDFPKTYLSESEIESFMNNRFKGSFEYKVADERLKAHLSKILYQAFQEKDLTHLDPYVQWMKTYMELKSDNIKKSIVNNRIIIDGDPVVSTRMKALAEWAKQLDPKGQIETAHYGQIRISFFERTSSTWATTYSTILPMRIKDETLTDFSINYQAPNHDQYKRIKSILKEQEPFILDHFGSYVTNFSKKVII